MSTTQNIQTLSHDDLKEARREYNHLRNTGLLKEHCGTSCVNCGSSEKIEYHHIVPLFLGGTNRYSNIVPLCYSCHRAFHGGQHKSKYVNWSQSGRKNHEKDEIAFRALDRLAAGEIGIRKCQEMMGLKNTTRPNQTAQYKRWTAQRGIAKMRDEYDMIASNSPESLVEGRPVGWIVYTDGTKKDILYHNTGLNDTVYTFTHINVEPMTITQFRERVLGEIELPDWAMPDAIGAIPVKRKIKADGRHGMKKAPMKTSSSYQVCYSSNVSGSGDKPSGDKPEDPADKTNSCKMQTVKLLDRPMSVWVDGFPTFVAGGDANVV